ncbi:G-protein alpha subunit-domain-containing protein, partial [Roridomyces roridus]
MSYQDERCEGLFLGNRQPRLEYIRGPPCTGEYSPILTSWKSRNIFDQQGVLTSSMNDMDSIIFLAPIWAFDQKLVDNPRINRLEDSFILWKDVVSSSVFERTNIILVLNKVDLMKRKLENGVRFADYVISYGDRPNDFESTSTYLRKHFASIHKQYSPSPRPLYYYFTTATDPGSAQRIIGRVRQMA